MNTKTKVLTVSPAVLTPVLAACAVVSAAGAATPVREMPMRVLMQFDGDPAEPRWIAVNDGVMGGLSRGAPEISDGRLRFSGVLSLANNGGFSSVRTLGRSYDLTGVAEVVMRVRGDGRQYQLRLATDATWRGITVSYGAPFATVAGQWQLVRVALDELQPSAHGASLRGPPFEPGHVREIGLLIGDKREGAFSLELDWIAVE
jgi:NADH dehydrogenase [ubiquinone] 1 alpha subcomplex assembly factor 1